MTELMRRRRALMAAGGGSPSPVLPDEYQQVAWLKCSAKAYNCVLTDVAVKDIATVEMDGDVYTSGDALPSLIFFRTSDSAARMGYFNNNSYLSAFTASPVTAISSTYSGVTVFTKKSGYSTEAAKLYLFGGPGPNGDGKSREFKAYKITINGGTLFNGIPVYRKSDNAKGLYDFVSGAFYPAVGSFTKGADVT